MSFSEESCSTRRRSQTATTRNRRYFAPARSVLVTHISETRRRSVLFLFSSVIERKSFFMMSNNLPGKVNSTDSTNKCANTGKLITVCLVLAEFIHTESTWPPHLIGLHHQNAPISMLYVEVTNTTCVSLSCKYYIWCRRASCLSDFFAEHIPV